MKQRKEEGKEEKDVTMSVKVRIGEKKIQI
jgi:hypothetical protein